MIIWIIFALLIGAIIGFISCAIFVNSGEKQPELFSDKLDTSTAEWIYHGKMLGDSLYQCSKCKFLTSVDDYEIKEYIYCPHCGKPITYKEIKNEE